MEFLAHNSINNMLSIRLKNLRGRHIFLSELRKIGRKDQALINVVNYFIINYFKLTHVKQRFIEFYILSLAHFTINPSIPSTVMSITIYWPIQSVLYRPINVSNTYFKDNIQYINFIIYISNTYQDYLPRIE